MKTCTKCHVLKEASLFSRNPRARDGLCTWCKACSSSYAKKWRAANDLHLQEKARSYYAANKQEVRAKQKAYFATENGKKAKQAVDRAHYERNKPAIFERTKSIRIKFPERHAAYVKAWRQRNIHAVNAKSSWRRAAMKRATPLWADPIAIKAIFLKAEITSKETGVPHDVDHIVPLVSPRVQSLHLGNTIPKRSFVGPLIPIVQGLHCEANLAIITEKENRLKSNLRWPGMPDIKV